jgi:redox-sensitive bicupin YhaK (pirin superfamily)
LSAGTGITHSEHNHLDDKPTHLLQIWIRPNQERCHPNYGQASYAERLIPNQLCLIVSGNGREQSVKVNQDVSLFTARVAPGKTIPYQLPIHRKAWIQVVSGQINVNRSLLDSGDGLAIAEVENLSITANSASEFLLFDLR